MNLNINRITNLINLTGLLHKKITNYSNKCAVPVSCFQAKLDVLALIF